MSIRRVIVDGAVVGMQRGQHQVTGERGLDRDAAGLEVTNLTDHDDVRVLTQERLQRGSAKLMPISGRTST